MDYKDKTSCHTFIKKIPEGDYRLRDVCETCGFINYVNPKVVVGAVSDWKSEILLVKRAIEPRKGFWTIPAGYLEAGETIYEGAVRETWEEANARISIDCILGIYNIPRISQIYIVFRAKMLSSEYFPGDESQDAKLVSWNNIPWDELAFPSVTWALKHYHKALGFNNLVPEREPASFFWET